MNAIRLGVLICCAGCAAGTVVAAGLTDTPSQDLLSSYSYQSPPFETKQVADPSGVLLAEPLSSVEAPFIGRPDQPQKPAYRDFRALEEAIAQEKKRRSEALFSWELPSGQKVEIMAKPNVQVVNIPWTPMIAVQDEETTFTPAGATRKLEVRLPLAKVLW